MRHRGRYIKDMIYGANDGIITSFAIVAGVAGADLSGRIVLILGLANLFADGFSMAVSNYLGSKSERDFVRHAYDGAEQHIESNPGAEAHEMRELLSEHGYSASDAGVLAGLMLKNKKFFTDLMMHEELDISLHASGRVGDGAFATFAAFVGAGFIPLLPFFVAASRNLFLLSLIATAAALFCVGSLRSLATKRSFLFSGMEMLIVGGVAAVIAYGVGHGASLLMDTMSAGL